MEDIRTSIKKKALSIGFDAVGITGAEPLASAAEDLHRFLREDRHGDMNWMETTGDQRPAPASFFPEAESVIMVGLNYYRRREKMIFSPTLGSISIYARGRDYHKILRKKLKKLLAWIQEQEPAAEGRVFVDSFPIMEKPLAVRAGLGWIAKNTTLILKGKGSWYFLGGILLNLSLEPDEPLHEEYCGSCSRCLEACPTGALTAPFRLDARKCISYLTIEHQGAIDPVYQEKTGNYIFGCDICQMVCPWNQRFATETREPEFRNRFTGQQLNLKKLSRLTRSQYENMFEGTPVRRTGFERFQRNIETVLRKLDRPAPEKNSTE